MWWWIATAWAQNGVQRCVEQDLIFPLAPQEPACAGRAEIDVHSIHTCFPECSSLAQHFQVAIVNRGPRDAENVTVTIQSPTILYYTQTFDELLSQETLVTDPLLIDPADFDPLTTARVTHNGVDCSDVANEAPLTRGLWMGVWPEPIWDEDRDGYQDAACGGDDCNDFDPHVYPGAIEAPGEERNCDGIPGEEEPKRCSTTPSAALTLAFAVFSGRRRRYPS